MARLKPEQRHLLIDAISRGVKKSLVSQVLGVTYKTIRKWIKRTKHLKDRRRKPKESKITLDVELFIIGLRSLFKWGTSRIQQALRSKLPKFMEKKIVELNIKRPHNVILSRQAINNVLKKHKLNGYAKKHNSWKFFRAETANELWQLDIKGPFTVENKKYYWVICIDDYSRYMVLAEQFNHCPTIKEIFNALLPFIKKYKPKKILTDNNPFKKQWDKMLKENNIESLHAHPYYPQDKGKVERVIRTIAEEFIYFLKKFPEWLNNEVKEYQRWYNETRFHQGIKDYPANIFTVT